MMLRSIFAVLLSLTVLFSSAFAHPGSLDENGGHYDRQNGGYHYHSGENQGNNPTGQLTGEWVGRKTSPTDGGDPLPAPAFVVAALVGLFAVAAKISSSIRDKKESEEREEQARVDRQKRRNYYLTHDIRSISGMPEYAVVGPDGVPRNKTIGDEETYGAPFDVYISPNGYTYHRRGCKHAQMVANAITDSTKYRLKERRPCMYCLPDPLPDGKWYRDYLSCINECKQLEVTPIIEPPQK